VSEEIYQRSKIAAVLKKRHNQSDHQVELNLTAAMQRSSMLNEKAMQSQKRQQQHYQWQQIAWHNSDITSSTEEKG